MHVSVIDHPLVAERLTRLRDKTTKRAEFRRNLDELTAFGRGIFEPGRARAQTEARVHLGEVVEIVGDRTLDVALGIVLQHLEQCDHRSRVLLERPQARRPWQSGSGPLGDQPPDVNVAVARPFHQTRIGPLRMPHQERADARFGGETLGELVLGAHGDLEIVEAILLHEQHMRQESERRHSEALAVHMFGTERRDQDLGRRGKRVRQVLVHRFGNVPTAGDQLEVAKAGHALVGEGALSKDRTDTVQVTRDGSEMNQLPPGAFFGLTALVAQQFEIALQIIAAGLVPIIEPEVDIHCPDKAGAEALEGCMAASITQAREGTLYLMCGGKSEVFERAKPILEKLSASMRYIGPAGKAAEVKALVNMVMNINTAALAEGLGLGQALGLDLGMLREVFSQTGANSRVLQTDGEDMQNREHSCFFSAAHAAKDSGIALKLSKDQKLNLPLAAATKKQYERMVKAGLGELDKSGIAELTFRDRHQPKPGPVE